MFLRVTGQCIVITRTLQVFFFCGMRVLHRHTRLSGLSLLRSQMSRYRHMHRVCSMTRVFSLLQKSKGVVYL
jgi:hypothetical protein